MDEPETNWTWRPCRSANQCPESRSEGRGPSPSFLDAQKPSRISTGVEDPNLCKLRSMLVTGEQAGRPTRRPQP